MGIDQIAALVASSESETLALMNAHVPDWKTYDVDKAETQRGVSDMRGPHAG